MRDWLFILLLIVQVEDGQVDRCMKLLDIGMDLAEKKIIDASTPYLMLEDITSSMSSMDIAVKFPAVCPTVESLSFLCGGTVEELVASFPERSGMCFVLIVSFSVVLGVVVPSDRIASEDPVLLVTFYAGKAGEARAPPNFC